MKRMLLIVSGVLVIAVAFLIWDAMLLNRLDQSVSDPKSREDDLIKITDNLSDVASSEEFPESLEAAVGSEIINSESIDVYENTPEYEMKLTLCEDADSNIFLLMEFYKDGLSTVYELDDKKISELSGLFQNRTNNRDNTGSYQIKALLNPVYEQLYLLIKGKSTDEFSQTSFYRIDLADMSIHNLLSNTVRFGEAVFNSDYSLMAYSFDIPSANSANREEKVLEIYDCKNGKYTVRSNRAVDGQQIGVNHSKDYLYDYELVGWESKNVVRLSQGLREISSPDMEAIESVVLYDVRNNLLMNDDGSEWKPVQQNSDKDREDSEQESSGSANDSGQSGAIGDTVAGDGTEVKDPSAADGTGTGNPSAASKPVDVLKAFYSYLQSEKDYYKAMQLLDDKFILRMGMLRQFGVEEITKNDIDAGYNQENVSLYSGLLKAAKLDTISKETAVDDNTVVIRYYQVLGLSADSQIRQMMTAKLVRRSGEYKIILIEDEVQ